ncbi:MAG: hypothetical protein MK207_13080 [Saprospiraceae bacterium]|nr:hypothetical protein [Saprospiraceae bacterium]
MSLFLFSCGDNSTTTNEENSNDSITEVASSENTTEIFEDASGKITADIVQKACACQESAKRDDGSMDIDLVRSCMGGKNKIEFVKDLLGPDASDKERADAEKSLTEKMKAKCPN